MFIRIKQKISFFTYIDLVCCGFKLLLMTIEALNCLFYIVVLLLKQFIISFNIVFNYVMFAIGMTIFVKH